MGQLEGQALKSDCQVGLLPLFVTRVRIMWKLSESGSSSIQVSYDSNSYYFIDCYESQMS